MSLRVSGKNLDVGDTLRRHIEARIDAAVRTYFDGGYTGHVTLEPEGSWIRSDCAIHLDTGITLQAEGREQDARLSFERAAERIEKRLRRYKRRLKEHHPARKAEPVPATAYVIAAPDDEEEISPDYNPVIIAEETTDLHTMSVGRAVMTMDLAELPVVVFRHAGHGGVNVVYRRKDGNIGWIDPSLSAKPDRAHG